MWHPTEDELIQHLCGEAEDDLRPRLEAHLVECEDCRRACEEITGALTMVNATVAEPPEGFERIVWARVQQAIADTPRTSWWTWRQWAPAAAVVVVAVAGIALAGRSNTRVSSEEPVLARTGDDDVRARERVLYTALDSHFQQTELLLVELTNAAGLEGLEFERIAADELVAAGRLYRSTAETTGNHGLVQVLDELEPVLVEVARSPERIDARDWAWLRTRIDDSALLFKVRAANNDLRERVGHADQ